MNRVLLYYGSEIENTPVFNSNVKLDKWQDILDYAKKNGEFLYNSKKVYYYKLNNIDIIETIDNNRNMYNQYDFRLDRINNSYLKLRCTEKMVDFITPKLDYFNKQVHKLQVFLIDNMRICFDEYVEDGNIYYNIYLIVDNENKTIKFIDIINNLNQN